MGEADSKHWQLGRSAVGRWIVGLASVAALLIMLGLGGEFSRARLQAQAAQVVQGQATIADLRLLVRLLVDAETGQRGYLLTQRAEFLEPYRKAQSQVPSVLAQLQAGSASSPPRHVALDSLARLAEAKLAELRETLRLSDRGKHGQAVGRVAAGAGKRTMDAARRVADDIEASAREQLAVSKHRLDQLAALDSVFNGASPVVAFGALGIGFARLRRHTRAYSKEQAARDAAETRLQVALETAGASAWEWTLASGKVTWSALAYRLFGIQEGAAPVDYEQWRRQADPIEAHRLEQALSDVLNGRAQLLRADFTWMHPTLGKRWFHSVGRLHTDEHGIDRIVGVTIDVTEQSQRELDRSADLAEKDRFIATLGHELRNPLAPILNGLRLLDQSPGEPQAAQTRAMMRRQFGHLVRLVDDVLDLSRVRTGKLSLRLAELNMFEVVRDAVQSCQPMAQACRQAIEVRAPADLPTVRGDATRLVQVVANLLNNAVKFSPLGSQILVSLGTHDSEVIIRVQDSGPGIPDDKRDSIFEPFAQLGAPGHAAHSGLGIGLALVREFVGLHGGRAFVEPANDAVGSCFVVRLPSASCADALRSAQGFAS